MMHCGSREDFGLMTWCYRAISTLTTGEGIPILDGDISPEYTPFEAGLDFCVKMDKGDFIGAKPCMPKKNEESARRYAA